jgi:hypothetical protein
MNIIKNKVQAIGAAAIMSLALTQAASAENYFEIEGCKLDRPTDYREWVYVGTPVTPNDMNDGKAAFPEHYNV